MSCCNGGRMGECQCQKSDSINPCPYARNQVDEISGVEGNDRE